MGIRCTAEINCPKCESIEEVWYAPTCDFTTHRCSSCGYVIELAGYFEDVDTEGARKEHDDLMKNAIRKAGEGANDDECN